MSIMRQTQTLTQEAKIDVAWALVLLTLKHIQLNKNDISFIGILVHNGWKCGGQDTASMACSSLRLRKHQKILVTDALFLSWTC